MVQGVFEAIDHYETIGWFAKGWAFRPERPDEPVALELWWEHGLLMRFEADRPRPDLAAAGLGDGCHAFEAALPDAVLDGRPHLLHVLAADERVALESSPFIFTRPRFNGAVDVIDGQVIEGWVEDREDAGCPPILDVLADGVLIDRVPTGDGDGRPPGGGRWPFRVLLPVALCDGRARSVTVRVSNTGHGLKGCPFTVAIVPRTLPPSLPALEAEAQRLAAEQQRVARERLRHAIREIDDLAAYARWLALHDRQTPPPLPSAMSDVPVLSVIAGGDPRRIAALRERPGDGPVDVVTVHGHDVRHALDSARGRCVILLPDNVLPHPTAARWLLAAAGDEVAAVYADTDRIDPDGTRHTPHFMPDWDPERAMATGYPGVALLPRDVALAAAVRLQAEGLPAHAAAVTETALLGLPAQCIRHVPRVLFHRTDDGAPDPAERAVLVAAHLRTAGTPASVSARPDGTVRVRRAVPEPAPAVTLIIPTRDRLDLLRTCIDSIRTRTRYPAWRILVIDNDSREPETLAWLDSLAGDPRVRVHRRPGSFNFSAFNNEAVAMADTPLVGLVNNDVEVISADWLDEMVSLAVRPEVGAVGAKLLHADGRIQHGGVVVGFYGVADNAQRAFAGDDPGYHHSAAVVQNVSAVTAACLLCRTDVYRAVGGLDAERLAVAFSDVDFCLKIRACGLRVLWTPHALLYHYESASRGADRSPESRAREEREAEVLMRRWRTDRTPDPFYSPNLALQGYSHSRFAWPDHPDRCRGMDRPDQSASMCSSGS
ncbi:glycosyltransferase family 2 protein [Azospirillum halopraeferens]|uniref:glycosyltransferase family 2 protein n=1 Tax=Azospirillum halopraeferens TaxID=34010 RepID=UPI00040BC552|nr:glycosyltransferase family 2 protein [Azospirillum halopraeferens]